jgi:hypothetical protein
MEGEDAQKYLRHSLKLALFVPGGFFDFVKMREVNDFRDRVTDLREFVWIELS